MPVLSARRLAPLAARIAAPWLIIGTAACPLSDEYVIREVGAAPDPDAGPDAAGGGGAEPAGQGGAGGAGGAG
jgi:hypothetical protein